jgi:HSP20 family protein
MSKEDTGAAGLTRIARGLSELFGFLAALDDGRGPRRGRHEKDGMVIEYSFGKRSLGGEEEGAAEAQPAPPPRPRGAAKPRRREIIEPVTDLFDEPEEVVILFELPGTMPRDVRCALDGDVLELEAKGRGRLYRKEMRIEPKLAAGEPQLRLRNGILEVRLAKAR